MTDTAAIDILKSAILLEKRGKAFYGKISEQTSIQAVKDFFGMMADEEDKHVQILSDQYRAYQTRGTFAQPSKDSGASTAFASAVLTERLKREMTAASFEAAAIGAAMAMERGAIQLYARRAETAPGPEEKALYQWLADWEAEHLAFLANVDRDLTEAIWNDNHFWPL